MTRSISFTLFAIVCWESVTGGDLPIPRWCRYATRKSFSNCFPVVDWKRTRCVTAPGPPCRNSSNGAFLLGPDISKKTWVSPTLSETRSLIGAATKMLDCRIQTHMSATFFMFFPPLATNRTTIRLYPRHCPEIGRHKNEAIGRAILRIEG